MKAPGSQTQPAAKITLGEGLEDGEYRGEEDAKHSTGEQFYYEDGNYWRVAPAAQSNGGGVGQDLDELVYDDYEEPVEDDLDPQEAYYNSLMKRFNVFRVQIANPPEEIFTHAVTLPHFNAPRGHWEDRILNGSPSITDLYHMEQRFVLQAIARVEDLLTKKHLLDGRRGRNLSAWCWGLLGRCKAVDEMISEEVGIVRDLARRAIGVLRNWGSRESHGGKVGGKTEEPDQQDDHDEAADDHDGAEDDHNGAEDDIRNEGESSDEEGEIAEDQVGEDANDRSLENAIEPDSCGAFQADLVSQEEYLSSSANKLPSSEDTAALELVRQKLLQRLSSPSSTEETTPKSSKTDIHTGENPFLGVKTNSTLLRSEQYLVESTDQNDSVPPATSDAKVETNETGHVGGSGPSHSRLPAELQGEEIDEGEILPSNESEDEDEAPGSVVGSESRRPIPDPETAALATLDMIITVVGEFWGQKDLLAQREIWRERD